MTTYKEIIGTDIQSVTSDPTTVGQVWYNETEGELKTRNSFVGNAWSTGGALNQARISMGGAGTQTAALGFGGSTPVGSNFNNTEQYNGTSWTEVNDMNSGRTQMGDAGTQTSALGFGGNRSPLALCESWNGSSWTEVNDLNTQRRSLGGAGESNTAALAFGGWNPPIVTGKHRIMEWN